MNSLRGGGGVDREVWGSTSLKSSLYTDFDTEISLLHVFGVNNVNFPPLRFINEIFVFTKLAYSLFPQYLCKWLYNVFKGNLHTKWINWNTMMSNKVLYLKILYLNHAFHAINLLRFKCIWCQRGQKHLLKASLNHSTFAIIEKSDATSLSDLNKKFKLFSKIYLFYFYFLSVELHK